MRLLFYGEEYPNEENKWSALRLGFHPELESQDYRASMNPYQERKKSPLYPDSIECLVVEQNSSEKNDVCSYCFVYADQATKTALIEPVSTRERYRHKGLGTAMMHGVLQRCQTRGIEKCYLTAPPVKPSFERAIVNPDLETNYEHLLFLLSQYIHKSPSRFFCSDFCTRRYYAAESAESFVRMRTSPALPAKDRPAAPGAPLL